MKAKVGLFDANLCKKSVKYIAGTATTLSAILLFIDIPSACKPWAGGIYLLAIILIHLATFLHANSLRKVSIEIEGTKVNIITGDIFKQNGLKAIAFNEYFDTQTDNIIIGKESVNGKFIDSQLEEPIYNLDAHINNFPFDEEDIIEKDIQRKMGKTTRYRLGTICVYKDFLLTAFSKFDDKNQANLTMPEYLGFLINFWDKVNKIYAQRNVSTTIFGSGITRINGHRLISDEDLLKIMLWTFRISEMRFKYPANLTIVIHESKIDQINLLDIASMKNGI